MRIIPAQFFAALPLRIDFERMLEDRGYQSQPAHGSGGTILMHPRRNLVWKVADDPSTRAFADMMLGAPRDPALPRLFAVADRAAPYSVIAMEKLVAFPQHQKWTVWKEVYEATRGAPATDPFNVCRTLAWLRQEIAARGAMLDVQAKNVLLRRGTGQIVFFDPVY